MVQEARSVPSLKDEVERKILEQIQNVAVKFSTKQITEREYHQQLNVLWEVSSGIIDWTVLDQLSKILNTQPKPELHKRYFVKGEEIATLVRKLGGEKFALTIIKCGKVLKKSVNDSSEVDIGAPTEVCLKRMDATAKKLVEKGFKEF